MSEKVLSLVAALFVSVWTARHLGPSQFGQLSFAQSFAALFVALAPLGLTRILERDLVNSKEDINKIISTSFFLVILGAVVAYAGIAAIVFARDYDEVSRQLTLIVGLTAFLQVNTIFIAYFLSQVQAKSLAIANVTALTISNITKIGFILNDAPLAYFAFGFVLDWLLLLPILLTITRNTDAFPRISNFSFGTAKTLLKQAWPYILTGMLITFYMKIDTVMIKEMMGDYAVGQYSAAVRLSEGFYYIPVTIVSSLYPAIVNAKLQDEALYIRRLSNLYSLMFYMAIALSIVIAIASPYIISILYGAEYQGAITVLLIHIWASVFVFVSIGSGRWLLTENLQILSVANTFIGACINIGLNLILIPRYGIEGAAWSTIVSYGASGYFCFFIWKRSRPNFYMMTRSFFRLPSLHN